MENSKDLSLEEHHVGGRADFGALSSPALEATEVGEAAEKGEAPN